MSNPSVDTPLSGRTRRLKLEIIQAERALTLVDLQQWKAANPDLAEDLSPEAGSGSSFFDATDRLEERLASLHRFRLNAFNKGASFSGDTRPAAESARRLAARQTPELSRSQRLWKKFRKDPYGFLSDSKNPLLRRLRFLFAPKRSS